MKLNSWRGIGSDDGVLLTPYVPEGIMGYDDDDDGASYGRSVNLCSGTVGDRWEGLYGARFKWEDVTSGQQTLAVQ